MIRTLTRIYSAALALGWIVVGFDFWTKYDAISNAAGSSLAFAAVSASGALVIFFLDGVCR